MLKRELFSSDDKDDPEELSSSGEKLVSAESFTVVEDEGSMESGADGEEGVNELSHSGLLPSVTYRVVQVGPDGPVDPLSPTFANSSHNSQSNVQTLITNPLNGQLYVIGTSPQEIFTSNNSRSLAPRSNIQIENVRSANNTVRPRDDRRRATHNEVERRRRDKINNWIIKLSKIIPECTQDPGKGGFETQSKGGILAKACDYIAELRDANQRLAELAKDNEQLVGEMELMGRQLEQLKLENEQLRGQLMTQHCITLS